MRFFYFFLLLILCECSSAQTLKVYVTKSGKFSSDPKNATSYILVEKLESDSAYSVKQFDMREAMMMQGTYNDAGLSTPHGKFIYYHKLGAPPDTTNFIERVGYFSNGKRVGTWTEFAKKGVKRMQYTYEDNELNGPYTIYFNDYEGHWSVGTMVNGKLECKVYMYNADSLLIAETNYVHNNIVNRITHWVAAKPPEDYEEFVEKQLKRFEKKIHDSPSIVVKFTIDTTGKMLDPKIIKGNDAEINALLISALLSAKPYSPATYDGRAVPQVIYETFSLFHEKEAEDVIRRVTTKRKFEENYGQGAIIESRPRTNGPT